MFKGLERDLRALVKDTMQKESEAKEEDKQILKRWYNLCNRTYAISRRRVSDYICGPTIRELSLDDDQYATQVGGVLIPIILDMVNNFEYISQLVMKNSELMRDEIDNEISPILSSLETSWTESDSKIRTSVINGVNYSAKSISSQRKALRRIEVLSEEDIKFLRFVWDIRNSMHNNFMNSKKIKYTLVDEDTGRELVYELEAWSGIQFWDTPRWNIVIAKKLMGIMVKVIQDLEDLVQNSDDMRELS